MKQTIKKPLQFVAALLPLMIVGSIFTGIYSFSTYTTDMQNEMIAQTGSYELLLLVGTVQSVLDYGYIWNTVQLGLLDIWQGFTRSSGNI